MKNIALKLLFVSLFLLGAKASAQEFSKLDKSPLDIAMLKPSKTDPALVKVVYGRPQLKGRHMLGEQVKYGEVWRTGANEATEITFYKDGKFAGKPVKAGTYTLFTIPNEKEWVIILNKDTNVWGAYSYDQSHDALRVTIPVEKNDQVLEAFSIDFDKGNMFLGWDTTRIAIPVDL